MVLLQLIASVHDLMSGRAWTSPGGLQFPFKDAEMVSEKNDHFTDLLRLVKESSNDSEKAEVKAS